MTLALKDAQAGKRDLESAFFGEELDFNKTFFDKMFYI